MRLRSFIILLLVLIHLSVAGQVTKSITKKFDGSQQVSEHYAVLKSNKLTKHGPYTSYFRLNKEQQNSVKKGQDSLNYYVKQRGTYVQGKKHGEWMEYSRPNVFYTQGNYQQDKKIGTARLNHGVYLHQIFGYALDKRRI